MNDGTPGNPGRFKAVIRLSMSGHTEAALRPARCVPVVLAIALSALLASCTGSPSPPSTSGLGTPTPTAPSPEPSTAPTSLPSAAPAAAPTPSPTAPVVTADEPVCASSQLQIAYSPSLGGGAAGNFIVALGIWNRGSNPCKLRGWVTVQFLNPNGGLVPTHWVETTGNFSGSAQPVAVSLPPCASSGGCASDSAPAAYISVAGDDVINPCVTAASVRVLTPGASTAVVVNLRVDGFADGQVFCSDGKVWVLPIVSTYSALGPPFA